MGKQSQGKKVTSAKANKGKHQTLAQQWASVVASAPIGTNLPAVKPVTVDLTWRPAKHVSTRKKLDVQINKVKLSDYAPELVNIVAPKPVDVVEYGKKLKDYSNLPDNDRFVAPADYRTFKPGKQRTQASITLDDFMKGNVS